MSRVAARLVFLAFLGLIGGIIYNALYLQDLRNTAVSPREPAGVPAPTDPDGIVRLPPVSTDLPPLAKGQGGSLLVVRAVQRELATRGYDVGPIDGHLTEKTRAAIAAYERREGLPITGVASDDLLRHILLGDVTKPADPGPVAALGPAEPKAEDATSIKAVQQILADLGYSPGPIDGAMGTATSRAISAFQRDRKIAETGKITPEFLRELKAVSGRDLTEIAAQP